MQLKTQEHIDLMSQFEREFSKGTSFSVRFDREERHLWPIGRLYQHGQTNDLFIAYRRGYALAKSIYQTHAA